MKLEDLNKARHIIHLIKEYKYFLEVKRKCWDELSITKKETNYILKTAYGLLSKDITADEILSGLITETKQFFLICQISEQRSLSSMLELLA